MKIGIIINSETGNTYKVAEIIREKLISKGQNIEIKKVKAEGEIAPGSKIKLTENPSIDDYDALIFGGPVVAFSLTPVMKTYISGLGSLKGKKIACFVTKQLPFKWTGGNQAINSMKKKCKNKGAEVIKTGIINWKKEITNNLINDLAEELSNLFN